MEATDDFFALLPPFVSAEVLSILVEEAMMTTFPPQMFRLLSAVLRFGATSSRNHTIVTERKSGAGVVWEAFDPYIFMMGTAKGRVIPRFVMQNCTLYTGAVPMASVASFIEGQPLVSAMLVLIGLAFDDVDMIAAKATPPTSATEVAKMLLPLANSRLEHFTVSSGPGSTNFLTMVQLPQSIRHLGTSFDEGLLSSNNAWTNVTSLFLRIGRARVRFPVMPRLETLTISTDYYTTPELHVDWASCPLVTRLSISLDAPAHFFEGFAASPCRQTLQILRLNGNATEALPFLKPGPILSWLFICYRCALSIIPDLVGLARHIGYVWFDLNQEVDLAVVRPALEALCPVKMISICHELGKGDDEISALFGAKCCMETRTLCLSLRTSPTGCLFATPRPLQAFRDGIARGLCSLDVDIQTAEWGLPMSRATCAGTVGSLLQCCPVLTILTLRVHGICLDTLSRGASEVVANVREFKLVASDLESTFSGGFGWLTSWKSLQTLEISYAGNLAIAYVQSTLLSIINNCLTLRHIITNICGPKPSYLPAHIAYN